MVTIPSFEFPTFPGIIADDDTTGGDPGTISAADAQQLALLYEAALNRPADLTGLNFWIDQFESGRSVLNISDYFVNSPEFKAVFGDQAAMTNTQLIDVFYQNVLNRAGEDGGMTFWVGKLNDGMTREEVLYNFSISAENRDGSTYVTTLHNDGAGDWLF